MSSNPLPTRATLAGVPARIFRFTRSERAVHWLTALAFFSMLGSGLVIGRRGSFHNVMYAWHLTSAGVLLVGTALVALVGNRSALRASVKELVSLDDDDRAWLTTLPARLRKRAPKPRLARFNAGQKINFLLIVLLLGVLFASGLEVVIAGRRHNLIFGLHKLATIAAAILVGGHLYMALLNPSTRPALRGILTSTANGRGLTTRCGSRMSSSSRSGVQLHW